MENKLKENIIEYLKDVEKDAYTFLMNYEDVMIQAIEYMKENELDEDLIDNVKYLQDIQHNDILMIEDTLQDVREEIEYE